MASRTAVSALPWHHSMLDVDARAGLAGATLGLGAENRRSALTFRYSGMRNRRYCTSIFHDDDDARPRLPAAKSGGGLAAAFLLPAMPLRPLEAACSVPSGTAATRATAIAGCCWEGRRPRAHWGGGGRCG